MRVEFIVRKQMKLKLETAQALMAEVYNWACNEKHASEAPLSCADTCVVEAIEAFEKEFE